VGSSGIGNYITMKHIILGLLLITLSAGAATLTVDIPNADVPRVSEAFGVLYTLGHPANTNEVSYYTRLWIIDQTKLYERNKSNAGYQQPPMAMEPTPTPTATVTPTATPEQTVKAVR